MTSSVVSDSVVFVVHCHCRLLVMINDDENPENPDKENARSIGDEGQLSKHGS